MEHMLKLHKHKLAVASSKYNEYTTKRSNGVGAIDQALMR